MLYLSNILTVYLYYSRVSRVILCEMNVNMFNLLQHTLVFDIKNIRNRKEHCKIVQL